MREEDVGFAKRWLNLKIGAGGMDFGQKAVGAGGGGFMSSHAKTKKGPRKRKMIQKDPKLLGFLRGRRKFGDPSESNLYIKIAGRLAPGSESGVNCANSMLYDDLFYIFFFLFFRCHFRIVLRREIAWGGGRKAVGEGVVKGGGGVQSSNKDC